MSHDVHANSRAKMRAFRSDENILCHPTVGAGLVSYLSADWL